VTVGEQDQRPVAVPVAADSPGRRYESVDFLGRQVLTGPPRGVRHPSGRGDFPVYGAWRRSLDDV